MLVSSFCNRAVMFVYFSVVILRGVMCLF